MLRTSPPVISGIGDVVDLRAVTTVFQPLVRLDSQEVVGFEALSRGPAGTPWEEPLALFEAARAAGRVAEVDWICRTGAYRAAIEAGLSSGTSLFVNAEPAALSTPCPPDLAPVILDAQLRLRVVTELPERAFAADPTALLTAAASCRMSGWGVALDDVGAAPGSLAMMPFVQPDVVKIDMSLTHRPGTPEAARVVNAVRAYAERTGAAILAEGIETPDHLAAARAMGATLGQGWHFGRPGTLPETPSGPAWGMVPFLPTPAVREETPFDIVARERPTTEAPKSLLMPVTRYLEAKASDEAEPPVVLATFQDGKYLTPATRARFARFAERSPLVAVLATDLPSRPAAGVRGIALERRDPLRGEWDVIVVGPHFAGALVARDLGDDGPDGNRRFRYAVTYDRDLVLAAARSLLQWVVPT